MQVDGEVVASTTVVVIAADEDPVVVPGVDPDRDGLAATGLAGDPLLVGSIAAMLLLIGTAAVLWGRRKRGAMRERG